MTIICPHRHLSYATWRLHILRELYIAPARSPHQIFGYSPLERLPTQRRSFHLSDSRLKDGRGPDGGKNSRRQRARIRDHSRKSKDATRRLARDDAVPGRTRPSQEGLFQSHTLKQSQDLLGPAELSAFANKVSVKKENHELGQDADISQGYRQGWNPFTARGQGDLESMIADLEAMTKEAAEEPRTIVDRAKEAFSSGQSSINFPIRSFESPVKRRIKSMENREQPKRQATSEDYEVQLSKTPWGQMLSGPMRFDSATRARMPRPLLTSWGLVRSPQSSLDYLMPLELSDLPSLKAQMKPQEHRSAPSFKHEKTNSQTSKSPDGERIYMQPNSLLVQVISNELIDPLPKTKNKPAVSSRDLLQNLIPWRWKQALFKVNVYDRTQTRIDESTGKEVPNNKSRKDVADLRRLQWQKDIDARMNMMMCERLMIALDGLTTNNNSVTGVRAKRVYAMDLPENGELALEAQSIVHNSANSGSSRERSTTEVIDGSRVPRWHPGSIFLHIGSPTQYTRTISSWQRKNQVAGNSPSDPDYLPPLPDDPYIPPMITLRATHEKTSPLTVRLPMFNLTTLLGPAYADRVHESIFDYGPLDCRFWANVDIERSEYLASRAKQNADDSSSAMLGEEKEEAEMSAFLEEQNLIHRRGKYQTGRAAQSNDQDQSVVAKEYVVLIKSNAVKAPEFVHEIWQLWRYIGGRDGLWTGDELGEHETGDEKTPANHDGDVAEVMRQST